MWWFHAPLLLALPLLFLLLLPQNVTARFCEGGHICSLPRECCTQGCCPPYQGGPRQLPPPSEHVLNLFFISHWFFWCVVVAVILAILCAYSLWKKRRTLCGWGFNEHHTQSEGDSAGSCYAPPQYSRCNSFHHPPPPYTEVTSKPDLYPLVFTCNSDNGKGNGSSSYLMVQYFRNYIVRPAGSLSAASTVDSLSSSFICNANEANTLVPPPYSRAASPELGLHHYVTHAPPPQQPPPAASNQLMAGQYGLPRSASQLVDSSTSAAQIQSQAQAHAQAHAQAQAQAQAQHYATVALGGNGVLYSTRLQSSQSGNFSPEETVRSGMGMSSGMGGYHLQSQSDQHFRYMATSSSSLSDIFVNNSCVAGLGSTMMDGVPPTSGTATQAASLSSLAAGGTPVIYSNGCIQPNPLHNMDTCCQLSGPAGAAAAGGVGGAIGVASGTTVSSAASGVSSLANIGTPSSPPQATSPTGEVREILDQIRQLQAGVSYEQLLLGGGLGGGPTATHATGTKPRLQHTLSTPAAATPGAATSGSGSVSASVSASSSISGKSKKFYAPKPPNKALYIPMAALVTSSNGSGSSGAQRCVLKSPVSSVVSGASFFVNRGRVARKGWISRSAPTTPGSGLPPNRLGDDSPLLLNEHDEDVIEDDDEDDDDAIVYGCPEMEKNARDGARGRAKINSKNKAQTRNRLQGQGQGRSRHHNELE